MPSINSTFKTCACCLAGLPAQLSLVAPFSFPVAIGDAFIVYPGCDKQQSTCAMFGNLANYRGQPYIPVPELSV